MEVRMLGIFSSRKEERYFGLPGAYRLHDDLSPVWPKKLLDTDPFEKVESFNDPAKNGRKIGILTPEEFTKFLTVLDPDWLLLCHIRLYWVTSL
jgi:hypothetical protein